MNRRNSILLNRANKILKLLDYKYVNLTLNYSSIDILFPGISNISHTWELVFEYLKKENVNWQLRIENDRFILNIYI